MISIRNKNRMEISSSSSTENQLNLHHHNNPKGSTISDGLTTLTPTSEYSYGQPGQPTLDFDRKPFGQPQQLPQSHPHHQQHQQPHQPKWILVNSNPTNPDVIPTKANLPQGIYELFPGGFSCISFSFPITTTKTDKLFANNISKPFSYSISNIMNLNLAN